MPVNQLPNLDHVYAKWEQRVRQPAHAGGDPVGAPSEESYRKVVQDGKQRWRKKFGDNIQPQKLWRSKPIRQPALPLQEVQMKTIGQFKTTPTVFPEDLVKSRPIMGQCCSCMPDSKKDFGVPVGPSSGIKDVLTFPQQERGKSGFCFLAYVLRKKHIHKYPDVSLAVLTSQRVKDAVNQVALEQDSGENFRVRIQKRAADILKTMQACVSKPLLRFCAWFLFKFMTVFVHSIQVHTGQVAALKEAVQRGLPVVYLPLHRSHMDYVIQTFLIWTFGLKVPFVAAGDNLNVPFVGPLMRSLGGYFIRRKLDSQTGKKDAIYRAVLHSYMEELLVGGESMKFFLEGGRSRTGKAYPPKGGLLSVVMDVFNRGLVEDVYIVPVSISYEKLPDGSFTNELMGRSKVKETFFGAVSAVLSVFRNNYGNIRVDFGQPFSIKEFIQTNQKLSISSSPCSPMSPSQSPPPSTGGFLRPSGSNTSLYGTDVVMEEGRQVVDNLGQHVVYSCVQMTAIMCTNLLAFLLLTKHRQGTSQKTLVDDVEWLAEEIRLTKRDVGFSCNSKPEDVLNYACSMLGPDLVKWASNNSVKPVTSLPEVLELSYYGNPVLSIFVLDSVLVNAVLFLSGVNLGQVDGPVQTDISSVSKDQVLDVAQQLCKLLKYEFIFVAPCCNIEEVLAESLDHLVTGELLYSEQTVQYDGCHTVYDHQWAKRVSDSLSWADDDDDYDYTGEQIIKINVTSVNVIEKLTFLQRVLSPILEAYCVTALHINRVLNAEMPGVIALHINRVLNAEMPEDDFLHQLHRHAVDRVTQGIATFGESASLETLRNSIRSFKDLKIVDSYYAGNLRMLELHDHFEVRDNLGDYIHLLEELRV